MTRARSRRTGAKGDSDVAPCRRSSLAIGRGSLSVTTAGSVPPPVPQWLSMVTGETSAAANITGRAGHRPGARRPRRPAAVPPAPSRGRGARSGGCLACGGRVGHRLSLRSRRGCRHRLRSRNRGPRRILGPCGDCRPGRYRDAGSGFDAPRMVAREERIPRGRVARRQDIAPLVAFLAGLEASFVTGRCCPVDGDSTLRTSRVRAASMDVSDRIGRSGRIRTGDPQSPRLMRYQAALRSAEARRNIGARRRLGNGGNAGIQRSSSCRSSAARARSSRASGANPAAPLRGSAGVAAGSSAASVPLRLRRWRRSFCAPLMV